MAVFNVPAKQTNSVVMIDEFLGVDFTNYAHNVDVRRSPYAPNMVRSVPGKVRKSVGYEKVEHYDGAINGVFYRKGDDKALVHAGRKLYLGEKVLYEGMADKRSTAFEFAIPDADGKPKQKLFVLDGNNFLMYDGQEVVPVSEQATVPLVTIARAPSGGGVAYQELNLIGKKFSESFLGDGKSLRFQMSFSGLDADEVVAEVLNSKGVWQKKTEGVDFTVDRKAGVITFLEVPNVADIRESVIDGEDNVRITASRTVKGYAERITKCDIGVQFGVEGAADRLFVSGNKDFVNYDWFSAQNNPCYFGDLSYGVVGSGNSAVVGYSVLGNVLLAHKDENDMQWNAVGREGILIDNKPAFPIVLSTQGPGAVAKHSFAWLANEPLFLTKMGIYTLTTADVTGERHSQNRSFFLNGKLLHEPNLSEAVACVYKDMYVLAVNGVAYILDGLQPAAPQKGMPYSTRQYNAFYRTNLPARIIWQYDGRLWFGTAAGDVFRFYDDEMDYRAYNDAGKAILARWETPELDGARFYNKKTFRYIAVRLASAVATGVKMFAYSKGQWFAMGTKDTNCRYLDFGQVIFSKFTFDGDTTPKISASRAKVRRVDKARFAFENKEPDEPFGIFNIAVEFREGGKAR